MPQISIVKLSDVQKAKRFDAEYFKPEYLEIERKLRGVGSQYFGDVLMRITGGATPLGAEYSRKGIPFLRVQNIMQNYFHDDLVYISKSQNKEIERSTLKTHDVLLTITGAYGKSAIVEQRYNQANINQHSVVMRFKNGLNPYYVSTFLNCKYGKKQSDRNIVGLSRPALDYQRIKKYFLIPLLSQAFQGETERIVKCAHQAQSQSKQLYEHAETTLLEELGLVGYEPQHQRSFETTKRKVKQAKRCDAEYFQPKYDEINKIIFRSGYTLLQNICSTINYGTVPTSPYTNDNSGTPYIKGLNLKNTEIDKTKLDKIKNTENLSDKFYTKKGDIIISQMGTVGDVGVITENEEDWLFASFTIRARLKNIIEFNPLYIGLYIQNIAKQYYLLRNIAQASVRQNTDLPTIKNMPIPLIHASIQADIAKNITESHRLRKQSKDLLNIAKQAVEIAIEQNETAALAYLNTAACMNTCE